MLGNHRTGIQFWHPVWQDYRIWPRWCLVMPHQFAISPRWQHRHHCHQHRGFFQCTLTDCVWTIPVIRVEIKWETQCNPMIEKVCKFLRHSSHRRPLSSVVILCPSSMRVWCLDRVVVPTKLRKAVLKQLRSGHPGINWMKGIARSIVDSDIKKTVKSCVPYMEAQKIHLGLWTHPGHTQNNHGPRYMWILQALLMAWVFW